MLGHPKRSEDVRPLRLLVHSIFYRPELVGVALYTAQMSEWLARTGHHVTVVCPPPYYPEWRVRSGYSRWRYSRESLDGVGVRRCPIWLGQSPRGWRRVLYGASFALSSLPVVLREALRRPSVIAAIEPSVLNAVVSLIAARLVGSAAWLHIQDLEIDLAIGQGVLRRRWLRSIALRSEAWLMRRFDLVSTVSRPMAERVLQKGVPSRRLWVFPNWVDTSQVKPPRVGSNPLRSELGIPTDVCVALYSGSMGWKQDLGLVLDAARRLSTVADLLFVVCGAGARFEELKAEAEPLSNTRFLPLQPPERLNDLLNLADLHLLPQRPAVSDLVMPSKILGMMASGRPVVATAIPDSEVCQLARVGGVVVEPGDAGRFAAAIADLARDPARRRQLGDAARRRVEQDFDQKRVLTRLNERLSSLVDLHRSPHRPQEALSPNPDECTNLVNQR